MDEVTKLRERVAALEDGLVRGLDLRGAEPMTVAHAESVGHLFLGSGLVDGASFRGDLTVYYRDVDHDGDLYMVAVLP